MSDRTHIQWTDASWNPIRAALVNFDTKHVDRLGWQCQRVSPGCQNCYAEGINKRLGTGLRDVAAEVEHVNTRRGSRNGRIRAIVAAALTRPATAADQEAGE